MTECSNHETDKPQQLCSSLERTKILRSGAEHRSPPGLCAEPPPVHTVHPRLQSNTWREVCCEVCGRHHQHHRISTNCCSASTTPSSRGWTLKTHSSVCCGGAEVELRWGRGGAKVGQFPGKESSETEDGEIPSQRSIQTVSGLWLDQDRRTLLQVPPTQACAVE